LTEIEQGGDIIPNIYLSQKHRFWRRFQPLSCVLSICGRSLFTALLAIAAPSEATYGDSLSSLLFPFYFLFGRSGRIRPTAQNCEERVERREQRVTPFRTPDIGK